MGKYTQGASELLDNYSALDLVAAFLKNLAKDEVKVKITPEKPLPYKGDGRHRRGKGHGRGNNHGRDDYRRRRNNNSYRHNGNRGKRGHGNGHEFVIKNKKG